MDHSQFFSVEHQCSVNVHPLSAQESLPDEAAFELEIPTPFKLSSEVAHLDAASLRCLRNLGENSEELTDYLKMQARKIDVLLGYVLSLQDDESERHQTTSLSAGGLHYLAPTPVALGQHVRLKLFLSAQSLAIYCYGEVIDCQPHNENSYKIQLRYSRLRETDQEHLIRATLHIQTQQLKNRRG